MKSAKVVGGVYILIGKALESQSSALLDINPTVTLPIEKDLADIFLSQESFQTSS